MPRIAGIFVSWFLLLCLSGCDYREPSGSSTLPPPVHFDLDSIRARGSLILLTENSESTYYLYRGEARGFDFETVKAFARSLGVKLEIRLLDDVNKMFELLNKGEGDIIASNITITPERSEIVAFSHPVYKAREVLVQRKIPPEGAGYAFITDTSMLHQIPVWVHQYSSFYTRLKEIEASTGKLLNIHYAPGKISTDDLIRLTASGELPATVTDENLARIQQLDYPELDMSLAISGEQDIAWAVRSNSSQLLTELNNWMEKSSIRKRLQRTYRKYFGEDKLNDYRGPYVLPMISEDRISQYDSLFRKYSPLIGWDWRLLAALVYQESRFNPNAVSWSGAFGLMQLMPETALRMGCDSSQTEEPNIKAGVKYIQFLDRYWQDKIQDPSERLKFVLASYNIGPGHIADARVIARAIGKSDTVWDAHVADCLLLKNQEQYYTMPGVKHGYCNSREPYHFVNQILTVYAHYQQKIKSP